MSGNVLPNTITEYVLYVFIQVCCKQPHTVSLYVLIYYPIGYSSLMYIAMKEQIGPELYYNFR